jgi:hypothetical protein
MIGYDDFLDGYLETEVDENIQNSNNLKVCKNLETDKLAGIVEDDEENANEKHIEEVVAEAFAIVEELMEELPTDSESEQFEAEQYKWIDDLEEKEAIASQNAVIKTNSGQNSKLAYSEIADIDVILPLQSDDLEIELDGSEEKEKISIDILKIEDTQIISSSDTFYDIIEDKTAGCLVNDDIPCSIQLTEPNYSQLLESGGCNYQDICRICNNNNDTHDPDNWLMCFGCGEAFHRACLKQKLKRVKCEIPLNYKTRLEAPEENQNRFTHAPWFCNSCVKCSYCDGLKVEETSGPKTELIYALKDSFVSCRHCGKVKCMSCYNSGESSCSNNSVELSRFSDLKHYSCPGCLQCINCGLNARLPGTENRRKSTAASLVKQGIILYDDLTLCRPCYLSNQVCATCPRCNQIYHSLPDHYDFGEADFNSEFSLCPMISCDYCGSWTHCQCEGISEEEYNRLGSDKSAKFTCFNCKKTEETKSKRRKRADKQFYENFIHRIGNLILRNDLILFNFWSSDEPWKRKTYKLSYEKIGGKNSHVLVLKGEDDENDRIEADSVTKLTFKFTEKFRISRFDGVNCFKAICPKFLLNPLRLLTFLESTNQGEFCDHLRDEILKDEEFACARTRPFKLIKEDFVKTIMKEKRPFSLAASLPEIKTTSETIVNTGKMTVKFLYSQYTHTLKTDLEKSINTIDVYSCGLALRPSAISGFGLFATRPFQRNSLIIEYCGEMLTGEPIVNKRDTYYNALGKRYKQSCYLFRLDELKVLDATHKGNLSRFINHSCDPNCYSRVVQIDSSKKLLIFASKFIEPGEEIVYDYKFPDEEQKIPCLCCSEKCRKWMN